MISRPIVSVIIAAFNVEPYIERAIQSALDQTVRDIEVIIVDDSSTDHTASVVLGFADPRIKLYQNHENRGPSFSRNYAISKAKGQWVAVLDADDWWSPNRLDELLEVAEQYNADIVCDDVYLIDDGADSPSTTYLKSREKVIGPLENVVEVTPQEMVDDDSTILKPMVRASFLLQQAVQYKEHMYVSEDYVFLLDCLLKGAKMVIVPRAHYYYRWRSDSLSKGALAGWKNHYDMLHDLSTSEPYNLNADLSQALQRRLRRASRALEEIRARELFLQRKFLAAAFVVAANPGLLVGYARSVKHRLVQ